MDGGVVEDGDGPPPPLCAYASGTGEELTSVDQKLLRNHDGTTDWSNKKTTRRHLMKYLPREISVHWLFMRKNKKKVKTKEYNKNKVSS